MQAQVCRILVLTLSPVACSGAGVLWVCRRHRHHSPQIPSLCYLPTCFPASSSLESQAPNWSSAGVSKGWLRFKLARGILPVTPGLLPLLTSISSYPETHSPTLPQALKKAPLPSSTPLSPSPPTGLPVLLPAILSKQSQECTWLKSSQVFFLLRMKPRCPAPPNPHLLSPSPSHLQTLTSASSSWPQAGSLECLAKVGCSSSSALKVASRTGVQRPPPSTNSSQVGKRWGLQFAPLSAAPNRDPLVSGG